MYDDINQGANSKLEAYIFEKEKQDGENSFAEYLSRSRWVHISSLADFKQFQFIVQRIKKAKEINPLLKVSVDPGYEYTKTYKLELREIFSIADYVFLNHNEVENRRYMDEIIRNEKYNIKQIVELLIRKIKMQMSTFCMGIITGLIASLLVWWIQLLFN